MELSFRSIVALLFVICGPVWAAVPAVSEQGRRAEPGRKDVFYTLDFESVPLLLNPKNWPVDKADSHDGLVVEHIGMYAQPKSDQGPHGSDGSLETDADRTAAVQSLPHVQVIANGKDPSPLTGAKYLKGTVYVRPFEVRYKGSDYQVNYCGVNGDDCGTSSGRDKPRVNLRAIKAVERAFEADSSHGAYRETQYWCFDVGFPSAYHEDSERRLTLMQIVSPATTPENNIDLSIVGNRNGAAFNVERLYAAGDGKVGSAEYAQGKPIPVYSTPVTAGMRGKMVTHCFKANIDNRIGGTPSFKWMMSVQGAKKLTTIAADTVRYGYSPFAPDPSGDRTEKPITFVWNLPYGGSLNGNRGPYQGEYRGEAVSLVLDNVRIGGPASSIADVHPLRFPEPQCGPPYPCEDP